jgi:hypothetical protein
MSKHLTLALLAGFILAACADDEATPVNQADAGEDTTLDDVSGGDTTTEDTFIPTDNGATTDAATPDAAMPDVAMEDTTVVPDVVEPTDTVVEDTATDTAVETDTTVVPDVVTPEGAVLTGVVSRSGAPARDGDGIGDLYIAVLDGNPLAGFGGGGGPAPNAVGVQLIENADLSSTSTQIEYRIEGIPPRAEAYYISAFLDDDGNAEPGAGAEPDRGDLLNLESLLPPALPTLVMDAASAYEYDIDLNQTRPF